MVTCFSDAFICVLGAENKAMHAVSGGRLLPASPVSSASCNTSSTWRIPHPTVSSPEFSDSKEEEDMDIDPDEISQRADSVLQMSSALSPRNRSLTLFSLSDLTISEQYRKPAKRELSKRAYSFHSPSSQNTSASSLNPAKQTVCALTYESLESDCHSSNLSDVGLSHLSSPGITRKEQLSLASLNQVNGISIAHGTLQSPCLPYGQHKLRNKSFLFSVAFLIIAVAMFVGVYHSPAAHCVDNIDLKSLRHELEHRVHGQCIAANVVMKRLEEFTTASNKRLLVMSFHGWTGIGKNFMSSIVAQHLPSINIHKFLVPLHFARAVENDGSLLSDWIISNISSPSCGLLLFIIDEIDKAHGSLVHSLRETLIELSTRSNVNFRAIFLLLTNDGAAEINGAVTDVLTNGGSREDLQLADLVPSLSSEWYRELVSAKLIDQVVPFLPLERQHVAQCAEAELRQRQAPVTRQLIDDIVNSLSYFPADALLFSSSGCRRITHLVDLFL